MRAVMALYITIILYNFYFVKEFSKLESLKDRKCCEVRERRALRENFALLT